jgi:hypothetical protein
MYKSIKWAAQLAHVREVSLLGTADLQFWTDWLRTEDLRPAECDGKAQLMVIAADAKYMRLRFQELSFSVMVQPQDSDAPQGAVYLVGAFNSRRFFAFCERVLFSTPYEYGGVALSTAMPAAIELARDRQTGFRAAMNTGRATQRETLRACDDGWEGAVYLPSKGRQKRRADKLFFARLSGFTKVYPFVAGTDWLTIEPTVNSTVLRAIRDAQFVAKEWVIREDAEHAKSKTYKRQSRDFSGNGCP